MPIMKDATYLNFRNTVNKASIWGAAGTIMIVSAIIGYAIVEVAYRAYQYSTISGILLDTVRAKYSDNSSIPSIFDPDIGYRYMPNIVFKPEHSHFPVEWRTNSQGLVARGEFPTEKPAGVFRIGLVGDSFTANVTNTIRWGDILEDELNTSPKWRDRVQGRRTEVINFGLDGIGTVQFGTVVEKLVRPYGIDLLLVNMIRGDVMRRPYRRGNGTKVPETELANWIRREALSKMPWFSPYPELLAVTMGQFIGLDRRLTIERAGNLLMGQPYYDTAEEAAERSAASARLVERYFHNAIWLLHPVWDQYTNQPNPSGNDKLELSSFSQFKALVSDINFVDMMERVRKPGSRAEIDSWFNVPSDRHNSDLGLRIYGEAVAQVLMDPNGPEVRASVPVQ
jgi:hypothetical protein